MIAFVRFAFLAVLVAIETAAWFKFADGIVAFYVLIAGCFLGTKIFNWPDPSWFGGGHIASVQGRWAAEEIGRDYSATERLAATKSNTAARTYFAASIYKDNTDKLCNQVNDSMTMKSILAVLGTLAAVLIASKSRPADFTSFEYLTKFFAAASGALLPLVWDLSRCEKQKFWNREVRGPD
jgi:hypothetical protein